MLRGLYQTMTDKTDPKYWLFILLMIATIGVAYLLGSLNFAVIVSRNKYKDDIRNHGSGNGGATNMQRTYGNMAAVLTMGGDMLKAVVAVTVGSALLGAIFGGYMAAFFCVLGHMFPIFFRFKGGKGVATSAAAMLMLNPSVFAVIILTFIVVVLSTKYISLGSIMAAALYPVVLNRINEITADWFILNGTLAGSFDEIFAMLMAVMVIFMHRTNIKRLINGTESKISLRRKK